MPIVRQRELCVNIEQKFSNTAPFSNLTQLPHLRLAGLSCNIMMMIDDSLNQYINLIQCISKTD